VRRPAPGATALTVAVKLTDWPTPSDGRGGQRRGGAGLVDDVGQGQLVLSLPLKHRNSRYRRVNECEPTPALNSV